MFSRHRVKPAKGLELLLLEDPLALFSLFSQMKSSDYDTIGEAVGHIFLGNHRSADLLVLCATEEIFSTDRTEQLLRQDSIYIVILQQFVKSRGRTWLYQTLRKPLRKILRPEFSIEIDKMRLPADEDLSINRNNLEQTIRSVLDPIFDHPENLPPEIGALCCLLFRLTDQKFPGEGYKVLSGSLFLRFICPFISSPNSWHLLTRHEIKPQTRRKLILVAKVVQGIANEITEFNEGYMNQIHDILAEYIEKLHVFHDKLMHISPSLEAIAWESIKEKKSTTPYVVILKEFFLSNFSNIVQEVIKPLGTIYPPAELFGKRLELLLSDTLLPSEYLLLDEHTKHLVQNSVSTELKELRKARGKQLWQSLLHDLVEFLKVQEELGEPVEVFRFQIVHYYSPNDFAINTNEVRSFSKGFKLRRRARKRASRSNTASVYLPAPANHLEVYKPTQSLLIAGEMDSFTELSDFHDNTELSEASVNGEEHCSLRIWLQQLEFGEFYRLFRDAGITEVQQLLPLTNQQLKEIGIEPEKIRQQIILSANAMHRSPAPKRRKRTRKTESKQRRRTKRRSTKDSEAKQELEEEAVAAITEL